MKYLSWIISFASWLLGLKPTTEEQLGGVKQINKDMAQTIQEVRDDKVIKDANNSLSHDELAKWVQSQQSHPE